MLRLPRIVPWESTKEWDYVYDCLYSTDQFAQRFGVDRVKAWRSRGKVPHSIDTTATFLEIQLNDTHDVNVPGSQLQILYTMAFVRFVNGVVDPAQTRQFAQSVSVLAESMGLPAWFVDIRHAGTHDQLPSLQLLRSGCELALDWLDNNYWQLQRQSVPESSEELRSLLKRWKDARKVDIKEDTVEMGEGCFRILREFESKVTEDNYRDILIPLLLEEGSLVPMAKKCLELRAPLPDLLYRIWSPLLFRMHELYPVFYVSLNSAIIKDILATNELFDVTLNTKQFTMQAWCMYLTKRLSLSDDFDISQSIEAILRHPFVEFVKLYATDFPLATFEHMIKAGRAHVDKQDNLSSKENMMYASRIEDIKGYLSLTSQTALVQPNIAIESESPWFMYPETNWSACKLGMQPKNISSDLECADRSTSAPMEAQEINTVDMDIDEYVAVDAPALVITADAIAKLIILL